MDLDQVDDHERLTKFLDDLFTNGRVMKLGFRFAEDLIQIRRRLPECNSLYEPNNLVCISKIIEHVRLFVWSFDILARELRRKVGLSHVIEVGLTLRRQFDNNAELQTS